MSVGVTCGVWVPLQVPITKAVGATGRSPQTPERLPPPVVSTEVNTGTASKKAAADKKIQLANILVATDFSRFSHRALDYAISLARRYDSHILLTHVIAPDAYPLAAPEVTVGLVETQRRNAENKIQEVLFSGKLSGVPYHVLVEEGSLWPAIQKVIEKQSIDPTDFGQGSEREAAYAFSIAQEHDARLTLLHVVHHLEDYSDEGMTLEREEINRRLRELVPGGAETWCRVELRLTVGDAAAEILRYAEEARADLIVMGAKARSGLAGHLPGTTAYKVVSKAHCPVLTVRS